jgi:type I restriction enzyme M protein
MEIVNDVYDPFCRTGNFLFEVLNHINSSKKIYGKTQNRLSYKVTVIKSIMLQIECDVSLKSIYANTDSARFDCVITNPPFGILGNKNHISNVGEWSERFMGISTELDYLCHVLDNLNDFGQAAIIVPIGLLFKEGKVKAFRQKMIEGNILQGIVELPLGIFYGTNVKTAIFIINKSKKNSSSLLVNATMLGNKTKDRCLLSEGDMSYIIELFTAYANGIETNSDNSLVVTNEMFVQNDYDFQFHKYKPNNAPKSKKRNSHEILAEIQNLKELYALSYNDMLQLINTKPSD